MDDGWQDRQLAGESCRAASGLTLRMSRLRSAESHHGGPVGLSGVVEELLVEVVADGFTLHCCGPKAAPHALVAAYEWDHYACVDLLTVRDFDRVITARVPIEGCAVDIFAPEVVVWAYEGSPQPALRALLKLVHPTHRDAPTLGYPAPAGLHVPRARQRPMTIKLPAPGRVGVRAARLAEGGVWAFEGSPPLVDPTAPDAGLPTAGRPPTSPGREEVHHVCRRIATGSGPVVR